MKPREAGVMGLVCAALGGVMGLMIGWQAWSGPELDLPDKPRSVFVTRDPMKVSSSIGLGDHDIPAGSEFFIEVLVQKEQSPGAHLTSNCGFVTPDGREIWCTAGDEITFPPYAPAGGMEPTPEVIAAFQKAADEPPLPPQDDDIAWMDEIKQALQTELRERKGAVYTELRTWGKQGVSYQIITDEGDPELIDSKFRIAMARGELEKLTDGKVRSFVTVENADKDKDPEYILHEHGALLERRDGKLYYAGTDETAMTLGKHVGYKDRNKATEVFVPGAGWVKVADLAKQAESQANARN